MTIDVENASLTLDVSSTSYSGYLRPSVRWRSGKKYKTMHYLLGYVTGQDEIALNPLDIESLQPCASGDSVELRTKIAHHPPKLFNVCSSFGASQRLLC